MISFHSDSVDFVMDFRVNLEVSEMASAKMVSAIVSASTMWGSILTFRIGFALGENSGWVFASSCGFRGSILNFCIGSILSK